MQTQLNQWCWESHVGQAKSELPARTSKTTIMESWQLRIGWCFQCFHGSHASCATRQRNWGTKGPAMTGAMPTNSPWHRPELRSNSSIDPNGHQSPIGLSHQDFSGAGWQVEDGMSIPLKSISPWLHSFARWRGAHPPSHCTGSWSLWSFKIYLSMAQIPVTRCRRVAGKALGRCL